MIVIRADPPPPATLSTIHSRILNKPRARFVEMSKSDPGHIGDGFYGGGTKWGRVMSGHENGDGLNKCIIPRPHSCVEDVPRSTTKPDKMGTVLKGLLNDV